MRVNWRGIAIDALAVVGAGAIVVGLGLVYVPLALVVGGAALVATAVVLR